MSKLYEMFKRFKMLLNPHVLVRMPADLKKSHTRYLAALLLTTGILDLVSMAVKGANAASNNGYKMIAFILLIAYFSSIFLNKYQKYVLDQKWQNIYAKSDDYINGTVIKVSNTVRGKVYSTTPNGAMEVMQNSEIIFQLHNYIRIVWDFWKNFPITIFSTFSLLILSFSMLYLEWKTSASHHSTAVLFCLLVICAAFYVYVTKKKIKTHDVYRHDLQAYKKKSEKIKDTLKNIEPIDTEEFNYRANLFLKTLSKIHALEKELYANLNKSETQKAIVVAAFMFCILGMEVFSAGGIDAMSSNVIVEVIAISAIYQAVLDKLDVILKNVESIVNSYKDLNAYSIDFDNIMATYNQVSTMTFDTTVVTEVKVNPMVAEYPKKESAYKLIVDFVFTLKKGCCYLFFGPTGCGKSTLIHFICGKLLLTPSPISYGISNMRGYLASLLHETNGRLGTEFVLNEIIFSPNPEDVDKGKLLEILKGLNLYDNVKSNLGLTEDNAETDEQVIKYLASTSIEEYSAGQKQRLAIAKLLYNLKPRHQIIAFDEATNALDSNTTIHVLKFIKEYCMKDTPRILIFASHQIAEMMTIVDEAYTFDQKDAPTSKLVKVEHS